MAQAAMSPPAYRAAEPVRTAPSRITYVETVYDPVVRTRAPYPSAMRRARRRARLTGLITLTAVTLAGWAMLTPPHDPLPPVPARRADVRGKVAIGTTADTGPSSRGVSRRTAAR